MGHFGPSQSPSTSLQRSCLDWILILGRRRLRMC